jgi:hypothetical protein
VVAAASRGCHAEQAGKLLLRLLDSLLNLLAIRAILGG